MHSSADTTSFCSDTTEIEAENSLPVDAFLGKLRAIFLCPFWSKDFSILFQRQTVGDRTT